MTPEKQRIAIAEACGINHGVLCAGTDYLNDLNAMHKAEGMLYQDPNLPKKYTQQIKAAICREAGVKKAKMDFDMCITATARQRAEAFLRTIGKWTTTDQPTNTMNDTPTPRIDERKASFTSDTIRQLETELASVTEQRDGLHELHNKNAARSKELLELCGTLREQRDMLAEALEQLMTYSVNSCCEDQHERSVWREAKEALQSLNLDHTVDANDMIAAVKGGADEIPR